MKPCLPPDPRALVLWLVGPLFLVLLSVGVPWAATRAEEDVPATPTIDFVSPLTTPTPAGGPPPAAIPRPSATATAGPTPTASPTPTHPCTNPDPHCHANGHLRAFSGFTLGDPDRHDGSARGPDAALAWRGCTPDGVGERVDGMGRAESLAPNSVQASGAIPGGAPHLLWGGRRQDSADGLNTVDQVAL